MPLARRVGAIALARVVVPMPVAPLMRMMGVLLVGWRGIGRGCIILMAGVMEWLPQGAILRVSPPAGGAIDWTPAHRAGEGGKRGEQRVKQNGAAKASLPR